MDADEDDDDNPMSKVVVPSQKEVIQVALNAQFNIHSNWTKIIRANY